VNHYNKPRYYKQSQPPKKRKATTVNHTKGTLVVLIGPCRLFCSFETTTERHEGRYNWKHRLITLGCQNRRRACQVRRYCWYPNLSAMIFPSTMSRELQSHYSDEETGRDDNLPTLGYVCSSCLITVRPYPEAFWPATF
jgi:hypothetical protein